VRQMRVLFGLSWGIVIGIVATIWFYANGGHIIFAGRELGPSGAPFADRPIAFTSQRASAATRFESPAATSPAGNMAPDSLASNVFPSLSSGPPPLQGSDSPPSQGFSWPPSQTTGPKQTSDAIPPKRRL
jgi:hypothetical protein